MKTSGRGLVSFAVPSLGSLRFVGSKRMEFDRELGHQRAASRRRTSAQGMEFAARQGWMVVQEFTDHAISGATLLRAGFQALMRDALNRRFDVVLAESLDRFSRDQEDTAGLFKRLTFAGVNIVTLAEGDITHLHIGFKGTMNALFLKDLAEKTHRGLRGRVEARKAGGFAASSRQSRTTLRVRF